MCILRLIQYTSKCPIFQALFFYFVFFRFSLSWVLAFCFRYVQLDRAVFFLVLSSQSFFIFQKIFHFVACFYATNGGFGGMCESDVSFFFPFPLFLLSSYPYLHFPLITLFRLPPLPSYSPLSEQVTCPAGGPILP